MGRQIELITIIIITAPQQPFPAADLQRDFQLHFKVPTKATERARVLLLKRQG